MILMIDNYDSFTYNLVQYLSVLGKEIKTVRNDAVSVNEALALDPELIVISPGPGKPAQAGICIDLIKAVPATTPVFGVCLGFQSMVAAFGGEIVHAPYLMHGKISAIHHDQKGIYKGLNSPFNATRYHSLIAAAESLPECFEITSRTEDDLIMGISHKEKNMQGVQFHPESFLTEFGHQMIRNLLAPIGIPNPESDGQSK